jgi:aspartyl-tRNA(Asn)/glutamyl-tRNA(Gln) amidotransferase subunit C
MKISKEEVEHLAKLANLELSEEEREEFTQQLDEFLQYATKVNEIDTTEIKPTSHVVFLKNVLREDSIKESLPQEIALSNAPKQERAHFKVPKVIE